MLTPSNIELYDRQIRLFGFETQKKLLDLCVELYSAGNEYISGEIAKNFILLGSTTILDDNSKESLAKVWEDYKEHTHGTNILKISVNTDKTADFYICTGCLSYSNVKCKCEKIEEQEIVQQLLLGGIFVQEIVKKINNEEYKKEFVLNYI